MNALIWYCADVIQTIFTHFCLIIFHLLTLIPELCILFIEYFLTTPQTFSSILITGASKGMGKALAVDYCKNAKKEGKNLHLILIARSKDLLNQVKTECESYNTENTNLIKVVTFICDVCDKDKMKDIILQCDTKYTLDLVFANAGYVNYDGNINEIAYKTVDVNCIGALNTILPIIPRFIKRKKGQIAIHSSIGALLVSHREGSTPMYCASKSFLLSLGENFRSTLKRHNIGVTTICPGFVSSGFMHELPNNVPLRFVIDVDTAVKQISRAIAYNRSVVVFPYWPALFAYCTQGSTLLWKQFALDTQLGSIVNGWNVMKPRFFKN